MGSILNGDKLLQTQVDFTALFSDALKIRTEADAAIEALAKRIDTKTKVSVYNWLGDVPAVQQWKDERPIGKIQADGYQITTKRWANGIEVDEDDLEDDTLGLYAPAIQSLADKFRVHKANLLVDFLINGFATTKYGPGYDGVAFFSAAHPSAGGGAAQSNLMTASLDDTGALYSAIEKIDNLDGLDNEPAGYDGTHLIYGPANQLNVDNLLASEVLAGGASNPTYKRLIPLKSPKLKGAYAGYWFVADLSKSLKPLILQVRRDTRFRSVGHLGEGENSYENFLRGKLYYGCDARYNAGYGLWQTIVGSNGTT